MRKHYLALAVLLPILACGSSGSDTGSSGSSGGSDGTSATPGGSSGSTPGSSGNPSPNDGGTPTNPTGLTGIWKVDGTDARGAYSGEVELVSKDGKLSITRVVKYATAKVEDNRELHWVWQGTATGSSSKLDVKVPLKRADFMTKRGTVTRTATDTPVEVTGSFAASAAGTITGTFTGPDLGATETWTARRDSGASPIFADERVTNAAHDPPSTTVKTTLFGTYSNFRTLAAVTPYVNRPEFNAAVHGHVVDTTDFAFYQANPNALRVLGKVIDDVSLGETLVRANAYRATLKAKADKFQADMETRWVDSFVGMVVDGAAPGSTVHEPSGDSALWTGTYVAAQAYRFQVTGEAIAKTNMITSLEALLKLQEITGDWSSFARVLRRSNGPATGDWHTGTGIYAGLDWREGGNNDMLKGILYGLTLGYEVLCTNGATGYDAMCKRIRTNAKHIADDVNTSQGFNQLPGTWLSAWVDDSLSYRAKAEAFWVAAKVEKKNNPVFYEQGTADWSGTHLGFIGDTIGMLLASHINLGGDAVQVHKDEIDASHENLAKQRLAVWHLIHAAYGSGAKSSPFVDDMRWRLREIPYPKTSYPIDHRINPDFCMSPYPALPWKTDWMDYPNPDRTQSLVSYPIFEQETDVSYWKVGLNYDGGGPYESPGVDFLHAYWYARKFGILSATE